MKYQSFLIESIIGNFLSIMYILINLSIRYLFRLYQPGMPGTKYQCGGGPLGEWAGGHPGLSWPTYCFPGDGFCGCKGTGGSQGAGGQVAGAVGWQ